MGLVTYQFWGSTLIGLGLLAWFSRNIQESVLQRNFVLALFIANALSCVMAVRGQFAGANSFGWSMVALFFLLALGFGTFILRKPRVGDTQSAGSKKEPQETLARAFE
jgi:hypothetical protein